MQKLFKLSKREWNQTIMPHLIITLHVLLGRVKFTIPELMFDKI